MSGGVAIAGLGRTHQGLGPFIARAVLEAGHGITLVAGRTAERAKDAIQSFEASLPDERRRDFEPTAIASADLEAALAEARVSALIIATPVDVHDDALEAAARAGVSVLCEKPIVRPGAAAAARVEELVARFEEAGRSLEELCQWPYTLPAFRELHPNAPDQPTEFTMTLAPASDGPERIVDSLSHPLSLLTTLAGPGQLRPDVMDVTLDETESGERAALRVQFRVASQSGNETRVDIRLLQVPSPPRPAAYGWDGYDAVREIDLPKYAQRFVDPKRGGSGVPVADPLRALIADVLPRLSRPRTGPGPSARMRDIGTRIRILSDLVAAHP